MSDSVDRVFVHALNTVKKIPRTGSARPPPADRLKLYGLYKQSMEGDVDGVMDRPIGDGADVGAEREKWDAWHRQKGVSKTEAKRRYISTLIETMHKYASATPDARELVAELEFVWDQIKSNVLSSSSFSSSPPRNPKLPSEPPQISDAPLRVLSPVSQIDDAENGQQDDFEDGQEEEFAEDDAAMLPSGSDEARNRRWRRRVEKALVKMTAEVAALREQLESRRTSNWRRRRSFWSWLIWLVWKSFQHLLIDAAFLGLLLLWMRRKRRDRRLEDSLRMLFVVAKEKLLKWRNR
ncbi:MAG: hypothetical protein M4579_002369 [Chaenotheca gracillima]|nr:MAG: hypothetical protein M4579_002369 [Chaenotheca gracillima]